MATNKFQMGVSTNNRYIEPNFFIKKAIYLGSDIQVYKRRIHLLTIQLFVQYSVG